jgi:putative nucleotidyltransferase with HDIG domain
MSRYREITSRTIARLLPNSLQSGRSGRIIVYALLAVIAVIVVLAGAVAALAGDMFDGTPLEQAVYSGLWGALGAATATLLALLLIPFIRDGLGLAEDVRLLEAASPAHPLLKELITKAPGTYTHSVATANLAEAAAEQIGADPLVARVGAYYHDIGKIKRPVYFFENQQPGCNPHDDTKPSLSALIITAHVHDGILLAEEFRLPPKVRAIIRQHHGTSLVRYFYNKAAIDDANVYEADFRYQGERPTSAEAALVMLADGCEAAVRALKQPTQERVEGVVHDVIAEKVADHQLEDAGLKPGDLEIIAAVYSRMLVSMYHARCEYPPITDVERTLLVADQHREPSRA